MTEVRRSFNRETPELRQQALIQSTLSLIARGGLTAATVRTIAEEAGVTQGLIRHYFKSKEDLISAAYEVHMNGLMDAATKELDREFQTAHARLSTFVIASISPPIVDPPGAMHLWAAFINSALHDEALRAIHKKTYLRFRDYLEVLIKNALDESGQKYDRRYLLRLAIACTAIIDGLWLEGGALPENFESGELSSIGVSSVGSIIGLDLESIV